MKKNTILKKIVFTVAIVFYLGGNIETNAQGLYINTGAGYNLAAGSQSLGTNTTQTSATIVCGSFGKGISFGAGFGYMFTPNIGTELGFSYLAGSGYTFTDIYGSETSTTKTKSKMLRIIPAIKITAGEKLKPYAKFGVVIGLIPKLDVEMTGTGSPGFFYTETHKLSGGSSIGLMGALGIDFKLSEMFSIFTEVNMINQTWAPGKDEYQEPAIEYDPSTGIYIQVIKAGTTTYVETVNENGPDNEDLKEYLAFGSFGINAGIKISFGGAGSAAK